MEKLLINTPQNVRIEYQLASLGTRMVALGIDYAIMVSYGFLVFYFASKFLSGISDPFLVRGTVMFLTLPIMLYHFILESFLGGQTVGKRLLKIKVVRLDGGRASVYEYFIRWTLNVVDIWMMSGVVGLLSIVLSKHSQRVGDMAAGTTVISLKARLALSQTVYEELAEQYEPSYPEYQVRKLSDQDINIIKKSFQDAWKHNNAAVLERLAEKITEVTGTEPGNYGHARFIELILKDHFYYHSER